MDNRYGILALSSNYALFGDMSQQVMTVIEGLVPALEVYSIDEAFADLDRTGQGDLGRGTEENRHSDRGRHRANQDVGEVGQRCSQALAASSLISPPRTRRRFPREFNARMVAERQQPGISVVSVW
tara:strand:- start:759 stop:1136 length:378 start_codon:yes stop_codon:yes gene_type:complete